MIGSPALGFVAAWILMTALFWLVRKWPPAPVNRWFRSSSRSRPGSWPSRHGGNDAQKTMGIITLALFASGKISTFEIPLWVKVACALAMAAGTYSGGWRIIHTLGSKVIKLDPIHGFAAETSAASVIQLATHFGIPGLDDAHDHRRHHGRGVHAASLRGPLGCGRQHRDGLGAYAAGGRPRRRRRLPAGHRHLLTLRLGRCST